MDVARGAQPDEHEHLEYVPTQVVAEYLRRRFAHPDGPVMGVLWRSRLDRSVINCVLFIDNVGCTNVREEGDRRPQLLELLDGSTEIIDSP